VGCAAREPPHRFQSTHSVRVAADTGTLSPSRRIWINHVPLASFRGLGTFIL
jgi:hypothetical protein